MNAVRIDDPLAETAGGFFHEVLLSELNTCNPKYFAECDRITAKDYSLQHRNSIYPVQG